MTTAKEFCNRRVAIAKRIETLADAAARMRAQHVGSLVVVEDRDGLRKPVGVLTDRDIVVRILAHANHHIDSMLVEDAMSRDPITAFEDEDVARVIDRMRSHGVRRIPIVDADGGLAGIITFDEIFRYMVDELQMMSNTLPRELAHEH